MCAHAVFHLLHIFPAILIVFSLLAWQSQQAMALPEAESAQTRAATAMPEPQAMTVPEREASVAPPGNERPDGPDMMPAKLNQGQPLQPVQQMQAEQQAQKEQSAASTMQAGISVEETIWRELEPGLEHTEVNSTGLRLNVLRIDPAVFSFVLCAAGREDGELRTLREWGEAFDLSAATNASMYLPDGLTSTGYMRDGSYINNKRIVQRFGAFFVAGPDDPDLPPATIIEKDNDIWKELLPHYRLVIQNYRIVNSQRRILWSPGGPLYSISAIAIDGEGRILFLHSRNPIETYTFAQQLLHLPLNVRTVMYVEGGGQAGLLIRSKALDKEVRGTNSMGILVTGNWEVRLPNVLGIHRTHR